MLKMFWSTSLYLSHVGDQVLIEMIPAWSLLQLIDIVKVGMLRNSQTYADKLSNLKHSKAYDIPNLIR